LLDKHINLLNKEQTISRQNKNKRVINQRKQVTKTHQAGVQSLGTKRTKQPKEQRHSIGFSKKLTSGKKGRCIVKEGKRISANV
jgi:hypothetical protein